MHLADAILDNTTSYVIAGSAWAATVAGIVVGGVKAENRQVVHTGVMAAVVFAVSMIHIPLGITSTHLGLYAISALVAGRRLLLLAPVVLFLQALVGHGGILACGLNSVNLVSGGFTALLLFKALKKVRVPIIVCSFSAGFIGFSVVITLVYLELLVITPGVKMAGIIYIWLVTALIEAVITAAAYPLFMKITGTGSNEKVIP